MPIVGIYGGLGNALFQLCFALRLREGLSKKVWVDTIGLQSEYASLLEELATQLGTGLGVCRYWKRLFSSGVLSRGIPRHLELKTLSMAGLVYVEKEWGVIPETKARYFRGYFQNVELARQYKQLLSGAIRNLLAAKGYDVDRPMKRSRCFVHIRRGDYLSVNAKKVHGVIDRRYYERAMKQLPSFDFVFFSDDPQWVLGEFPGARVWSGGQQSSGSRYYDDLFELFSMSRFEAGIIANSTFSYWAAILGSEVNKTVIMPERWFHSDALQAHAYRLRPAEWVVM